LGYRPKTSFRVWFIYKTKLKLEKFKRKSYWRN
jgi:hypothetical protein